MEYANCAERSVTEALGATLGTASVYSLGALLLFLKQGIPDLKTLSKPYPFIGGFFFVAYELLFSQSFNGCLFRDACMPKSILRSA